MERNEPGQTSMMDQIIKEVSAENLMRYTETIAQWIRLSGSEDEAKAFQYIDSLLRNWGIETEFSSPTCYVSLPINAQLEVSTTGIQFECITHSFSIATGSSGVEGELIYAGQGTKADLQDVDLKGKIALLDGPATPDKADLIEGCGAIGVIHISQGAYTKEMIISPVWGNPTEESIHRLPTLPHISVNEPDGNNLKTSLGEGPVRVRIVTDVETKWQPLPVLVASIRPDNPADDFVLLSGHVDSWHFGALDNGTANASMLEVARILQAHRSGLRRSVRVAFWSGHSHARYATSAWYTDEHWMELHDHCIAHVNIDGPGAKAATDVSRAPTMAETHDLARELIRDLTEQELKYHRIERMGDQSLWGVGVPSFYVTISDPGPEGSMEWHHTVLDTLDYVDAELLVRDAKILLATVYRLASDRVLTINPHAGVLEIARELERVESLLEGHLDLTAVHLEAQALLSQLERLRDAIPSPATDDAAETYNRTILQVTRTLVPVNYTQNGPFGQDAALPTQCLPALQKAVQMAEIDFTDHQRNLLITELRREKNRIHFALRMSSKIVAYGLLAIQAGGHQHTL